MLSVIVCYQVITVMGVPGDVIRDCVLSSDYGDGGGFRFVVVGTVLFFFVMDICNITGELCPICLEGFRDGARVIVMGCNGGHIMCGECYDAYEQRQREEAEATVAATLFEAVRRNEGADKCPVCRQMSYCATEAVGYRFYSGKTKDDAIPVDEEESVVGEGHS